MLSSGNRISVFDRILVEQPQFQQRLVAGALLLFELFELYFGLDLTRSIFQYFLPSGIQTEMISEIFLIISVREYTLLIPYHSSFLYFTGQFILIWQTSGTQPAAITGCLSHSVDNILLELFNILTCVEKSLKRVSDDSHYSWYPIIQPSLQWVEKVRFIEYAPYYMAHTVWCSTNLQ